MNMEEQDEQETSGQQKRSIKKWTDEEVQQFNFFHFYFCSQTFNLQDAAMVKLVAEHGTRFWALIGAKLNGRTGKQVNLSKFTLKW